MVFGRADDTGVRHAAAGRCKLLERTQLQTEPDHGWVQRAFAHLPTVTLEKAELQSSSSPPLRLFAKAVWMTFVSTLGTGTKPAILAGYPETLTGACT